MDEAYRRALSRLKPLSKDEQVELHRRMRAGDKAAKDRLVESVLKLVYAIAKKYTNSRLSLDDFAAEGNYHAIRAVEAWEPDKGKLTTIVSTYVENGIHRFIVKNGHAGIFLPLTTYRAINAETPPECKPHRRWQLESARAASYIAQFSTLPRQHGNRHFDVIDEREGGEPVGFCLADVEPLLHHLATPLERKIFRLKFTTGDKPATYEQVGKAVGLSAAECHAMMRALTAKLNRESECKFCGERFVRGVKSKRYCSARCHRLGQKLINALHHRESRKRKRSERPKPVSV